MLRQARHVLREQIAWVSTSARAGVIDRPPTVNAAAPAVAYDDGLRKVLAHVLEDIQQAGTWKKEFNITTKQAAEIGVGGCWITHPTITQRSQACREARDPC